MRRSGSHADLLVLLGRRSDDGRVGMILINVDSIFYAVFLSVLAPIMPTAMRIGTGEWGDEHKINAEFSCGCFENRARIPGSLSALGSG